MRPDKVDIETLGAKRIDRQAQTIDYDLGSVEKAGGTWIRRAWGSGTGSSTSLIARVKEDKKLVGVNAQDRLITTIGSMAAVWPEVRHKVRPYRVVDNYGEMYGTDPSITRTDEEAQQLADVEAQQQAAAMEAEAIQKAGAGVKSMSEAKTNAGSALDALVGAL